MQFNGEALMSPDSTRNRSGLVAIGEASALKAQGRVAACQNCSHSVFRPFGSVLFEVLAEVRFSGEFFLSVPTYCPACGGVLIEDTLVRCEGERPEPAEGATHAFGPGCLEQTNVVLVGEATLSDATAFISGCVNCAENAHITFDYILDAITEDDPTVTEYVMCHPIRCPRCDGEVNEKTLVVAHD